MDDRATTLQRLAGEIAGCPRCDLAKTRTHAVPGEGNAGAKVVFIGEGPGFHEDQQARPFVGAAGKFLDELLAAVGWRREDVFIANVIKCRPPNNRDPLPEEIEACTPWLEQQLETIGAPVIVTLGRFAMGRYFRGQSIGKIHGQPKRIGDVTVVPMYHPAAALHQASLRRTIEEDFRKLPAIVEEALQSQPASREPQATQMQLL